MRTNELLVVRAPADAYYVLLSQHPSLQAAVQPRRAARTHLNE